MKVAIIGGGLVGRVAAWGVMQAGHCPVIFDRMYEKVAKTPRGFVYIHDRMFLPLKSYDIWVNEQGTKEEYCRKVYSDAILPYQTSFGKFTGKQIGHDPTELLGFLNGLQHGMVQDCNFETLDEVLEYRNDYERVVFTLPLANFVKEGNYPSVKGSVGTWKLDPGEDLSNYCVYNANEDIPWYRSGAMFGWAFREFPNVIPGHIPITKVVNGGKPPDHDNVLFTGRFGKWNKTALSSDSFYEVIDWLK